MTILTVKAEVELPRVPNFLRMADGQTIPVSAITEEGLRQLGAEWITALIANAKRQRETGCSGDAREPK